MDHELPPGFAQQLADADAEDARRAASDADPLTLMRAARWYAEVLGWPVFPLLPGGKAPHGLLAPRGFHDATTDLLLITHWWGYEPAANIGAPTGHLFDVIDVDGPEGYQSYFALKDAGELPPVLARAHTGRGLHLLIPPVADRVNGQRLLPGIDLRAAGGYVVLPPSLHPNGLRYRWEDWHGPLTLPTAPSAG